MPGNPYHKGGIRLGQKAVNRIAPGRKMVTLFWMNRETTRS
jgi:hypothetical protein